MTRLTMILLLLALLATSLSAQNDKPLTWQRDYFPAFRMDIADADLNRLLTVPLDKFNPDLTKYPITLHYQGEAIKGTIRLRGGNASRCGAKRQFRIDFPKKVTLPDGYKTDRFETDHGICNTLNEYLGWQLIDEAATRHPEIKVLSKHSNVVALYFNDQLYHVQSLLEDVSKDVLERNLGTRNVVQFKHGCYGLDLGASSEVKDLCLTSEVAQIEQAMDVPSYLYVNALVQILGSADMFPAYPWNSYLIYNQDTGRTHFLAHDLDMAIDYVSGVQHDPFVVTYKEGWGQHHFEALLADAKWGAVYRQYVQELTALVDPNFFAPLAAAKYEQVRDKLLTSPNLPFGSEYYDTQYRNKMPEWSAARFAYLNNLFANAPRPRLSFFGTLTWSHGESYSVVATDLNNDGSTDLAVTNVDAGSVSLIMALKEGAYWWPQDVQPVNVGGAPVAIAALDADGDGWNDLAIADYSGATITVWRNNHDGTFAKLAAMIVPNALSVNTVKASDGSWLLLAVSDGENGQGNLHRARVKDGLLEELSPVSAGAYAQPPSIGDLDGDGQPDAVFANWNARQLTTVFGVMNIESRVTTTAVSAALGATVVADFDQDGLPDVAALAPDANQLIRFRNQGSGVLAIDNIVDLPTGFWNGYYASIAAADFDGDSLLDVVISDYNEGIVRIFRGSTAGFANARSEWLVAGNKCYGTIAPDLNEDGKPDIVTLAGRQSWVPVYMNFGGFR